MTKSGKRKFVRNKNRTFNNNRQKKRRRKRPNLSRAMMRLKIGQTGIRDCTGIIKAWVVSISDCKLPGERRSKLGNVKTLPVLMRS